MISGDRTLVQGKQGAFYNTLGEFHKYWERIDIISPKIKNQRSKIKNIFDNVFIHPSPWPLILQPFWILKKGQKIYGEQKFDLMTVHEYPPFYNGIGARMLWGKIKVPYILEIHHIVGYPKAADLRERLYRWLTRAFIKYDSSKAKAVRVVNQRQVPEFLIEAGVPKEKIIYIPSLYIDLDIFRPMDLEKRYDLIFVGRLVKNKGIDLFLEAVKRLDCKAAIIGDGPLKEKIKFKIKNRKFKIDMYGWVEAQQEVTKLLNQSKILVMVSYNEGGPRVVGEAMACGVPVLATPVGIVPDIIKNGESGEITDWKAEDIAEKGWTLLKNKDKYEKYRQMAIRIASQFEKKSAIKNYALKIQDLAS